MSTVRTRFAPSPTGFFHIGSARTALFNWLYARHTGGCFILRVEDTDSARNEERYLRVIYESLRWLGLDWDEGPDAGGAHGPYKQSERGAIYREFLGRLRASGRAYDRDGAVWFRLAGARRVVREKYREGDRVLEREAEVVDAPPVCIHDVVRGDVMRAEDRDFVLVRANGEPGFHFANVVDDITMRITHVIRGEDHLSNTSKHVELYNALGVPPPVFAHIPLILKGDGRGKMSKRDRGALIEEYQARHFLPEAVRNFLCLLGWTPRDGREVLPVSDVVAQFELADVHQANARFDERKMSFINQQWLRLIEPGEFSRRAVPLLREAGLVAGGENAAFVQSVLGVLREKLPGLEDLPRFARYFFTDEFERDGAAREALEKKGDPVARVRELLPALEAVAGFEDAAALDAVVARTVAGTGRKPGEYFAPLRYAVSGLGGGPDLHSVLRILGRDRVLARARRFVSGA
ncbi:MAG: glutamate--tRNA ligase [Puniceicoccales bacterium]|nr:glutamate--tRNA ligase [Puniceicoccales bacterium]